MLKLEQTYEDDYTELLPVFLYTKEEPLAAIGPEMDRAIKKATKLISMHSLTVKPDIKPKRELSSKQKEYLSRKEYNKWVDEAYLLMGKSHFYKMEYEKAKETFEYILSNFIDNKSVFESKIWLARLALQEQRYREAEDYLSSLSKNILFPKELKGELNATWADYYIKLNIQQSGASENQENIKGAVDYLVKAIELTKHKPIRTRYLYLLAQIYLKTGDNEKASSCFDKVIHLNPPYKMAFNAKIYRALAFQEGESSRKDIEKQLLKMLKDDKNIDFRDQVYFAIGQLYYKDGNIDEALKYYKLSIAASTENKIQKTRTNLTIADIYYVKPDYVNAQAYYDSAVALMNTDFPDYQKIYAKSLSLTNLVKQINTVHFEDSVLVLSKKTQPELYAIIDRMIEQDIKAEQELRQKQYEESQARIESSALSAEINLPATSGNWYFYNPTVKSLGQKEFVKLWGNRKLEDNWRRKNKSTVSFGDASQGDDLEATEQTAGQAGKEPSKNKRAKEYYLVNIPFSDSAKAQSNKRIASALFSMGNIYNDELEDYKKAINTYEELLKRYPLDENRLQTYYKLYAIAKENQDIDRVGKYQQKIISEFPNSNIARLMTNPNYLDELKAQENEVVNYYNTTFSLFQSKNYPEAGSRSQKAMKDYPNHKLFPKFDYIYTVSTGLKKDTLQFVSDLQGYITRYPQTDLSENVKIMITYLQNKQPEIVEQQKLAVSRELYSFAPDKVHYFIYSVPLSVSMNQLVFNIINFNIDNFDKLKLEVTKEDFNKNSAFCLVSKFANADEAMTYLRSIILNEGIFRDVVKSGVEPFVISQSNYLVLKDSGILEQYMIFFRNNYK
jgi:tetratricopeptide (TPR) repeat protein